MILKQFAILFSSMLLLMVLAACGNSDSSSDADSGNNDEDTSTKETSNEEEDTADNKEITSEEASQTAEEFLTLLGKEAFSQSEALLNDMMVNEITAVELEEIWNQLLTDFGEFNGVDFVEEQEIDGYYSFIYEGAFGEQPVVFNVSIDRNNEIAGFYIQ